MKYLLATILLSVSIITGYAQDRQSDSLALVQVYNDLGGENWNDDFTAWLTATPIDQWEGITLQEDRVSKVVLKQSGAVGQFPMSILDLSELRTFEVKQAVIEGAIPAELTQLIKLDRLVLDQCNLTGSLPLIFDQFESLRTLVLSRNDLEGPLPNLGDKISLCYINGNNFSGPIPASWAARNVGALQIQDNNLTGEFSIVQDWPFLRSADFGNNDWDPATFPEWVDDIPTLERFSCEQCNLEGEIPTSLDFSNTPNYTGMFISDNNLSGDISLFFTNDQSEKDLYLVARNNSFSGEFPAHKLNSGFAVDLYNNKYSSTTPFGDIELSRFDIKFNKFNYSSLEVLAPQIESDSLIGVDYGNQLATLEVDTVNITEPQVVTLTAGDDHPNTTYQWRKGNTMLVGETNAEIVIEVDGPEDAGEYWCRMTNTDFPELTLNRERVTINVDISTSTNLPTKVDLSVYPNPSSGLIIISGLEGEVATVTTIDGAQVGTYAISGRGQVDLTSVPAGSYVISVVVDGHRRLTRLVKH